MAKASDLSTGSYIKFNGELCLIIEYIHRTPGNLRAFYQAKMRNIRTGKLAEYRFRPDEEVEEVRVEERNLQYLYKDGNDLVCMDGGTFEQYYVHENLFGEALSFLKEGSEVVVGFDGETPVLARPPKVVELEVTYTEPGLRGDTATKTLKPATLETGARISVPLFVNQGEKIRVNTETGEYLERVKE
ncbi:MAG: elongation factor P [Flavobacteriales bacterium]|nr:elongation factor P [Flavobacteriales bacterium]MCX7649085.1 elongation factor P [Flavobacteriales bacterium]MDW8431609.1 elongation factor P [Flavobacteriales bacterium]